jgi:hypothetical protein
VLVVSPEERFNGLTQLIFGLETSSVECLALQQAEHDFNLVQPTGRSGREVKPDSPVELRRMHPVNTVDSEMFGAECLRVAVRVVPVTAAGAACLSIPVENSPFCRSKNPPPRGEDGLQFQPAD